MTDNYIEGCEPLHDPSQQLKRAAKKHQEEKDRRYHALLSAGKAEQKRRYYESRKLEYCPGNPYAHMDWH